MYYKLLLNGTLVDALDELVYVKYDVHLGQFVICNSNDNPQGISSNRMGRCYHIDGMAEATGLETAQLQEVSVTEYELAKRLLDRDGITLDSLIEQTEKQAAIIDFNTMMGNLEEIPEVNDEE